MAHVDKIFIIDIYHILIMTQYGECWFIKLITIRIYNMRMRMVEHIYEMSPANNIGIKSHSKTMRIANHSWNI